MGRLNLWEYLPRSQVDWLATGFAFTMIPVAYLHGLYCVAPIVWPVSASDDSNWISYCSHVVFTTFLLTNTMANLVLVMVTDTSYRRVSLPVVSQPGWMFCPYCQYHTPPRSHHCTTCCTCILRRDHHCFFVGKCIGFYNHRYFVDFLIYVLVAAFYGVILSFRAIAILTGGLQWTIFPGLLFPVLAWLLQVMPVSGLMMVGTSVAIFTTLGTGALLAMQVHQLLRAQTLWEYRKGEERYSHGLRRNVEEIMGKNWWFCWLFPFIPSPLPGDGSHFPPLETGGHVTTCDSHMHPPESKRKLVKHL